jgi:hypothetical protein
MPKQNYVWITPGDTKEPTQKRYEAVIDLDKPGRVRLEQVGKSRRGRSKQPQESQSTGEVGRELGGEPTGLLISGLGKAERRIVGGQLAKSEKRERVSLRSILEQPTWDGTKYVPKPCPSAPSPLGLADCLKVPAGLPTRVRRIPATVPIRRAAA